jgi:hypothetical protein
VPCAFAQLLAAVLDELTPEVLTRRAAAMSIATCSG